MTTTSTRKTPAKTSKPASTPAAAQFPLPIGPIPAGESTEAGQPRDERDGTATRSSGHAPFCGMDDTDDPAEHRGFCESTFTGEQVRAQLLNGPAGALFTSRIRGYKHGIYQRSDVKGGHDEGMVMLAFEGDHSQTGPGDEVILTIESGRARSLAAQLTRTADLIEIDEKVTA